MIYHTPVGRRQMHRIKTLYKSAFPVQEQKPFFIIEKMYKLGKTDIWYFEQNGEFIGLATTINGKEEVLIDYFAVADEHRGKGYGTLMIKMLRGYYLPRGIFLEIEIPYEDSENREERVRRKNFYLNAGLKEMGTSVRLFDVDMELLGTGCALDFDKYRKFYLRNYGKYAYDHIERINII